MTSTTAGTTDPTPDKADGGKPKKKGGFSYSIVIAVLAICGAVLVMSTSFSGGRYDLEVAAITTSPDQYVGREIRVVGKIKEGSTHESRTDQGFELRFVVHDEKGSEVPVVYKGLKPDPYKEGRQCIVEGTFGNDHVLKVSKLTVKCPSKYQSEDGGGESDEYYREKYKSLPAPKSGGPTSVIDVEGACSQTVRNMAEARQAMGDYSLNKSKLMTDCTTAMNKAPEKERQAAVACFKAADDYMQGADCFESHPTIKF